MIDPDRFARLAVDAGYHLHKDLGPGLLESAYEQLLAEMLRGKGLDVIAQQAIDLRYRDIVIKGAYRADLIVEGRLLIEVKAVERLFPSTPGRSSPICACSTCRSDCS